MLPPEFQVPSSMNPDPLHPDSSTEGASPSAPTPPPVPVSPSAGRPAPSAVISLVLGILSVLFAILCVGVLPGLVGLVFGGFALRRRPDSRRLAAWGLGLSALGTVLSVAMLIWVVQQVQAVLSEEDDDEAPALSRWEGVSAPDLTVKTLSGAELKLSELQGKRVVLDFWATWCGPCVMEIPHFTQLYQETSRDQLEIVGVSDEDADTLRRFVKTKNVPYPIGAAVDAGAPYDQIKALPTTFFIDRRGIIQSVVVGYHDFEDLRAKALAPDTEGEAKAAPSQPVSGLRAAETGRALVPVWNRAVPWAMGMACGDWDGDSASDVVLVGGGKLERFNWDGEGTETRSWPNEDSILEIGRTRSGEARIAAYSNWGKRVRVVDRAGKELWTSPSSSGLDGAHWGDLDGDGDDELVVGHNGGGGLQAIGIDGKVRWEVGGLGNVWSQAVIPARDGKAGRVFITEAGGTVRSYDAQGAALGRFRLDDQYCAAMNAAWMGPAAGIQVIGEAGRESVAVADASGAVQWQFPVKGSPGNWRSTQFVSGDLTGDGVPEWVVRAGKKLVVASADGVELGTLEANDSIVSFATLPNATGPARLAVFFEQLLIVYELR